MNIFKFIESFTDDNLMNAKGSRRDSFNQFGKIGKTVALASIPFGLAAISTKSYAGVTDINPTPSTPTGALQLALTLEYLENEFYQMGLSSGVIPPSENGGRDLKVFQQIAQHESSHVAYLIQGLGSAGFVAKPTFDFTVGGLFDPFHDYQQFLALAQAFEDTGVRAYKGQAAYLMSKPDLLQAALQIHSVEARHASEVRRLREQKGWIVGNDRGGLPSQAQASYDGEENTNQAGYNAGTLFGASAGTESFDEPLTTQQTVNIANLFIV